MRGYWDGYGCRCTTRVRRGGSHVWVGGRGRLRGLEVDVVGREDARVSAPAGLNVRKERRCLSHEGSGNTRGRQCLTSRPVHHSPSTFISSILRGPDRDTRVRGHTAVTQLYTYPTRFARATIASSIVSPPDTRDRQASTSASNNDSHRRDCRSAAPPLFISFSRCFNRERGVVGRMAVSPTAKR